MPTSAFTCLLVVWSNATQVVFWFRKVQSTMVLNSYHDFIRTVDFSTGNCSIQLSYWSFSPFSAGNSCVRDQTTTGTVAVLFRPPRYLIPSGEWTVQDGLNFMLLGVCPLPHTGRCYSIKKKMYERSKQRKITSPKMRPIDY